MINKKDLVFFCGIGGIGMSAVAKIMHSDGYNIVGSNFGGAPDLEKCGIKVFSEHKKENVVGAKYFVYSTAIKENNPEFIYAKENGITILHRSDIVSYIMNDKKGLVISGTHGKTTTTAMLTSIFLSSNIKVTSLVGGLVKQLDCSNFCIGNSDYIIVEGDESDKSFLKFQRFVSIVTNVDFDHMENYLYDKNVLFNAFESFINETKDDGLVVLCKDDLILRDIIAPKVVHKNVVWYSVNKLDGCVFADNIRMDANGFIFDVVFPDKRISDITLNVFGLHNLSNALSVIIVGNYLKLSDDVIKDGIKSFGGVKRRFDFIGKFMGVDVIDDYAHHPAEIIATLKSLKHKYGSNSKILMIVEPHRYSRISKLLKDFGSIGKDADTIVITKIYGAFEDPCDFDNVSHVDVANEIIAAGHHSVLIANSIDDIKGIIESNIDDKNVIVFVGAGDVSAYARKLCF